MSGFPRECLGQFAVGHGDTLPYRSTTTATNRATKSVGTGTEANLNSIIFVYTVSWTAACALAVALAALCRDHIVLNRASYWRFLFAPWRLVTFLVALAGMIWLGPRSGDPTWDWIDASFMSTLAFLGAPWAMGALWRSAHRRLPWQPAYVAGCLWLFSASWSYDLYILMRDHGYPPSWLTNMLASSILYTFAGLMWNLDWSANRGVTLSFLAEEWPPVGERGGSLRMLLVALPLMAVVAALMLGFFLQ